MLVKDVIINVVKNKPEIVIAVSTFGLIASTAAIVSICRKRSKDKKELDGMIRLAKLLVSSKYMENEGE